MTKSKLVTPAQAREVVKLARDMELPRATFQAALTNGTVEKFLRGLIPKPLIYPDWHRRPQTPDFEVNELTDPGVVELWFSDYNSGSPYSNGVVLYEELKTEGLLASSLSFGHLKWLEKNPKRIPTSWRRRRLSVCAWASVALNADTGLEVPYLVCSLTKPCVAWRWIGYDFNGSFCAGLRT